MPHSDIVRTLAVGFDVGGSRSAMIAKLGASEPRVVEFTGSYKYSDIGIKTSVERCASTILQYFTPQSWDVLQVCITMSGASNAERNREFVGAFVQTFAPKEVHTTIEGDAAFALRAAYPSGESGYLLIAGTGSVAMARTRDGEIRKLGGWGRLLGDEGSGYWIGLEGLKYLVRVIDGTAHGGLLFDRLKAEIETRFTEGVPGLRTALYLNAVSPAEFAPIVFETARDSAAATIIHEGARHLASQVHLLGQQTDGKVTRTLTLHGSLGCNPDYVAAIAQALVEPMEIRLLDQRRILEFALATAEAL